MKVISPQAKRMLNHASPGMYDAQLGDVVEELQKEVIALREQVAELGGTPGDGSGGTGGSGSSTWETA